MEKLFHSDIEFAIRAGYAYMPLLVDHEIEKEVHGNKEARFWNLASLFRTEHKIQNVIRIEGRHYVKTASLQSLLDNYEKVNRAGYEIEKAKCLRQYEKDLEIKETIIDHKLETIVFKVMPYFIKKNKALERKRMSDLEIVGIINKHVNVPPKYLEIAEDFKDTKSLRETIDKIENKEIAIPPEPEQGPISSEYLRDWFYKALEARILIEEKENLKNLLKQREELIDTNKGFIATLLYLKDNPSLEIDGFGFGDTNLYKVYVHTGEYALKDFDGDIYLFPDCKVGVYISNLTSPLVFDKYKHPFLNDEDKDQFICIRHGSLSSNFTAENIINSLQTALNTIFYGYTNSGDFGGYNSLKNSMFQEYKISRDHPRIKSGEVEIKNDFI